MFISEVIFESERVNETVIRQIMKNKKDGTVNVDGLISAECWWKETADTVGFALVTKWNSKEQFQNWLRESHSGGHKKPAGERPKITKTAYQFESVE